MIICVFERIFMSLVQTKEGPSSRQTKTLIITTYQNFTNLKIWPLLLPLNSNEEERKMYT